MYTNSRSAARAYANVGRETGANIPEPAASQPALPQEAPRSVDKGTYATPRDTANAYASVGLETGVIAASPHKLIIMLYEGAELAVRMAIKHMNEGDVAKKSAAIGKASSIILEGLRAALDPQQGGEISQQLDALYEYMNGRLMFGHVNNQTAPLEEVLGLLQELHGAWQQIATPSQPTQQSPHSYAA